MTEFGFMLKKLQATGENVGPAEVSFTPGFNLITGASNTGKSYILQCLDFMFGSDRPPKEIYESQSYTKLFLELEDHKATVYTLERSLQGGDFHLYDRSIKELNDAESPRIIKANPDPTKDNSISWFLLSLCGIGPTKIRKNSRNETANLSFRTISHLFVVNETSIIAEESPVLLKEAIAVTNTKIKSAFKFLLTGIDDSSLIASPDPEMLKAQDAAKREVIDQLISDLEKRIESQQVSDENIRNRAIHLEREIELATTALSLTSITVQERQQDRETAWREQQEADSRLIVISELLKRFELLRQHYQSDLKRLEFISEGEHYFEQLEAINCPLCGTLLENHAYQKMCEVRTGEIDNLQRASEEEAAKIRSHLQDLEGTVATLIEERSALLTTSQQKKQVVAEADRFIAEELRPKLIASKMELDHLLSDQRALAEIDINTQRLDELKQIRVSIDNGDGQSPPVRQQSSGFSTFALRKLCDSIDVILREWKYPDVGIVEFNERQMDLVINGKPRQSNGKGVRALLHAAFAIGLMRYCKNNDFPHPYFVVLDSPLTTLKEGGSNESEDEVSGEIQRAFFEALSRSPKDEQIIVLENKVPSSEIKDRVNYIEFTGATNGGRKGFYPTK